MTTLNEETIRSLAAFDSHGAPVVTAYLDIDGRRYVRPQDYERELSRLIDAARSSNGAQEAGADLAWIQTHVHAGLDRSRVRGLAIFACSAQDLWMVVDLPVPVRSRILVNQTPQVAQLEALSESFHRLGVMAVDRQRARILVVEMGEILRALGRFDELPRHEDDKGEWDKDHVHDHQQVAAHHHLRRAAQQAFAAWQRERFDHLIIAGPEGISAEVERHLHPYVRDRVVARVGVAANASDEELRQIALRVEEQVERRRQSELVDRLRDSLGTRKGVVGLPDVLLAIAEGRAETILVSPGYEAPGWRCGRCGHLSTKGPSCQLCSNRMERVEDVIEEAVDEALLKSCRMVPCPENADLDVLGRIGALLRY